MPMAERYFRRGCSLARTPVYPVARYDRAGVRERRLGRPIGRRASGDARQAFSGTDGVTPITRPFRGWTEDI
jgi:hypothetical protein